MSVDDAFRRLLKQGRLTPQPPEAEPPAEEAPAAPAVDLDQLAQVEALDYAPLGGEAELAEEYRALRMRLQGQKLRRSSLMFTSAGRGEGTTTTAVHTALTMAQRREERVLLMDLNLRRPAVAGMLGLQPRQDVVDVICGLSEPHNAVIYSRADNLYILTARPHPGNFTETLESPPFGELMDRLHEAFDFIVVDVASCLLAAEPMLIGQYVGGAALVVKTHATRHEQVENALRALRENDVPVAGVTLTFVRDFVPRFLRPSA
jgi:receptor protein-tyrosine kinase